MPAARFLRDTDPDSVWMDRKQDTVAFTAWCFKIRQARHRLRTVTRRRGSLLRGYLDAVSTAIASPYE